MIVLCLLCMFEDDYTIDVTCNCLRLKTSRECPQKTQRRQTAHMIVYSAYDWVKRYSWYTERLDQYL